MDAIVPSCQASSPAIRSWLLIKYSGVSVIWLVRSCIAGLDYIVETEVRQYDVWAGHSGKSLLRRPPTLDTEDCLCDTLYGSL